MFKKLIYVCLILILFSSTSSGQEVGTISLPTVIFDGTTNGYIDTVNTRIIDLKGFTELWLYSYFDTLAVDTDTVTNNQGLRPKIVVKITPTTFGKSVRSRSGSTYTWTIIDSAMIDTVLVYPIHNIITDSLGVFDGAYFTVEKASNDSSSARWFGKIKGKR